MSLRRIAFGILLACLSQAAGAAPPAYTPEHGTQILWDRYGVPHVYAKTVADLYYCYGWAQAEAHGDLLLTVYGQSRGRAAEYFGPGPHDKNLKTDRWVWTNGVPARAEEWLKAQTPQFRGYLEAFAAGINAYAAKHPDKLSAEVKQVLPVTALDVMAHAEHFVYFEFVASPRLAEPVPVRQQAGLEWPAGTDPDTMLLADQDKEDGSNGWAIGPRHSASGHAMLLMNPHLAWAGETTYFEAELIAPGINLYGATQVGLPVMRFCLSDYLAITNTVNTNNGALLYKITEQDGGYLFDGAVKQFEKSEHAIKIRQPDGGMTEEKLEILSTVQGPVIRRDNGAPIALHVAGLDHPYMLEQIWKMDTSHTLDEFQAQMRRLQYPMYNVIYADRDGHIEYLFNAEVFRRSEGDYAFWARPVPGDTSQLLPDGYLDYDELPKIVDPASGYVQNSNEPPWDAAWPTMIDKAQYAPYVAPVAPAFRPFRGLRMLSEDEKISFDMMLQKKLSTHMELADRLLPDLLDAVDKYGSDRARQAADVLKKWNRDAEADSTGALLFYAWAQKFVNPAVNVAVPGGMRNFAVAYDVNQPLTTPRGLKDPKAAAAMLDEAAAETAQTYGAMDTPWGKVMRIEINDQSNGDIAVPRGPALNGVNLPGNGGYGNLGIIRVVTYGPMVDGTRTPIHGDGFTLAVEFAPVIHAKVLLSYGDSSQPGSPHHTDQLPLVENKQWRDVWRTKSDVEANLESKEAF
jgi:acyl-homoserine-lactone acylase